MIRNVKRLATTSLILLVLALLPVELVIRATTPQRRRSPAKSRGVPVGDLFRNNCARCHGGDGRGDTPLGHTYKTPDFTTPEGWRKNSKITRTRTLISLIRRGQGGMPAFWKKLKSPKISPLV